MAAVMWRLRLVALALSAGLLGGPMSVAAQTTTPLTVERTEQSSTLTFFNRPIAVLRARVMGREPDERAWAAEQVLTGIVKSGTVGAVASQPFEGGRLVTVGGRAVIVIHPADVDDLVGETVDTVTAQAMERMRRALREAAEARAPALLLREGAIAGLAIAVAVLLLWGLARGRRAVAAGIERLAERKFAASGLAPDTLHSSHVLDVQRGAVRIVATVAQLVVVYTSLTFVLRRFPYTRPWGEQMLGWLLSTAGRIGLAIVGAMPDLFIIAVIMVLARFVVRLMTIWFNAAERGQVRVGWLYPETAQPTRRLVSTLVWLFAIVVAYPYMPGSESEAFKGVSVFLGLLITFGSSGAVNQIMSSFMITYSRAVRIGDFVRIGDTEGIVTHLGLLSIKVRTPWNEEVTIPNAVVVAQTTTDFTRLSDSDGVFTPTSVTIGYDTPWRQVHAMLLLAAERTAGLRRTPEPTVLQRELQDFYVKYTLFVCLERQETKPFVLDALHANIQDVFNEYGVQIMSPNYVLDPERPKVVPRAHWFPAPAQPDSAPAETPVSRSA